MKIGVKLQQQQNNFLKVSDDCLFLNDIVMSRIINLVTQMEAGGAQGAAIRMSEEMRNRGIDAETWFIYKKFDTYINDKNVVVIHDSAPTSIVNVVQIIFKIVKLLKNKKPDGVITYTHYANVVGHVATTLAGIRNKVVTLRNPTYVYPKGVKIADKLMGKFGFYSIIIAVSETVKESCKTYSHNYKKKLRVVYNGVPARISALSKDDARKKFKLPGDKKILINVARLHPQKNQQLLIRIIAELKEYHLAIAGDGELKNSLIQLTKELNVAGRVHFLGEINPADVPDFLKAGDIFLFPSVYEAFGFVIFEAAHNGLPIIGSNIPSNKEVLTVNGNERAGIIVETMDVTDWIKAINAMEDQDLKQHLQSAMQTKLQEYNFNQMVNSYINYATTNN